MLFQSSKGARNLITQVGPARIWAWIQLHLHAVLNECVCGCTHWEACVVAVGVAFQRLREHLLRADGQPIGSGEEELRVTPQLQVWNHQWLTGILREILHFSPPE